MKKTTCHDNDCVCDCAQFALLGAFSNEIIEENSQAITDNIAVKNQLLHRLKSINLQAVK